MLFALATLALAVPAPQDEVVVLCRKVVTCAASEDTPQVIDDAAVHFADGKLVAIGPRAEIEIPETATVLDHSDAWVVPGLLDLHSHMGIGGAVVDWNDAVYQANPGLRVSSSAEPGNEHFQRALAGGVTSVLYLSGSGTNMSGAGVLLKTAPTTYAKSLIRDPGSLKIAQAGNPERWGPAMQRSWMNWNTRNTIRRGKLYAKAWEAFEAGEGPEPEFDPQWEIFRALAKGETIAAVHTQIYQVFLMSLTMLRQELDLPIFIAHGTFDSLRLADLCAELGVPAILGPRTVNTTFLVPGFAEIDTDGRFEGIAAGYQERGHTMIGFNTDAIHPDWSGGPHTEELQLQAAMGARYGMTNERVEILRGLTIVPALTMGIDDRVGSLEPGKDADLVISEGDPTDPRNRVRLVFVDGEPVYDRDEDPTVW